jgi:hypothetical protein
MNMKNFKRTLQSPTVLTILVLIMIVLVIKLLEQYVNPQT